MKPTLLQVIRGEIPRDHLEPDSPPCHGCDLLSTNEQPWLRWRFREITARSFLWTGETSTDGGRTWRPDDEMRAERVVEDPVSGR